MATDPNTPSFSRRRKWAIGFNVALTIVTVLALVVMANYLSGRYFKRAYLSSNTKVELSSRTINLLHSITNKVQVTLYYDKEEKLFSNVSDLLKEYRNTNPKITINIVDYYRDPGAAQEIKAKYNLGASSTNKNFVIFDLEGRTRIVDGNILAQYNLEQGQNEKKELEYTRKLEMFNGEMLFSSALLSISNPKPLIAYYLQGHGEQAVSDSNEGGYSTFATILAQNYVQLQPLTLLGSNTVPADCNMLIIAGPSAAIPAFELERIDEYLAQGGRLMALFDARSAAQQTGLEKILAKWGIRVGADLVIDVEHMEPNSKNLIVSAFVRHPILNSIIGSGLYMVLPRPVSRDTNVTERTGIPVQEIAFSGQNAYLYSDKEKRLSLLPVAAIVDETIKGTVRERGATRMIVVGDSFLFNNRQVEMLSNRDFLNAAINWLGERNVLLEGVGPKRVTEFRLVVTKARMRTLQWILLGAVPGGILLFGGIVWISRRK
jgi:hypothetical protein